MQLVLTSLTVIYLYIGFRVNANNYTWKENITPQANGVYVTGVLFQRIRVFIALYLDLCISNDFGAKYFCIIHERMYQKQNFPISFHNP